MFFRYLILSPSSTLRQKFLGGLLGSFELAPRGQGEKARLSTSEGDDLEIVGAGDVSKLNVSAKAIIKSGIQIDAVLMLLPSGDGDSWEETQRLTEWLRKEKKSLPVQTFVVDNRTEMDKPTSRKILKGLMDEHERAMRSG